MIVVTGAAGFIGSNLLKGLNAIGREDIIAVDDLTEGRRFVNLAQADFADYIDYEDFLTAVKSGAPWLDQVEVIFHQGACSTTTEWNGRYMMKNNYDYSKTLFHFSIEKNIAFIYASSAAVYGSDAEFNDASGIKQMPLNVYGYSKWLFDQYVLKRLPSIASRVVGLRYFNVYGPQEQHKGSMASVAFHLMQQLRDHEVVKLFEASHGYADGEQQRDFIYIDDVVKVNLWCWQQCQSSGIYNCGTGQARSFNAIAQSLLRLNDAGVIQYVPFPEKLKSAYQAYTQADLSRLRAAGYTDPFISLESGLQRYFAWFQQTDLRQTVSA